MNKIHVTEGQGRHGVTALEIVDMTAQRVQCLLDREIHHKGPAEIVSFLDQETLDTLRRLFHQLPTMAAKIYQRYGFRSRRLNLPRVRDAEISWLWEVLENCRPERMRGYGSMEPETASMLGRDVEALLKAIQQLRAYLLRAEPKQQRPREGTGR